VTKCLADIVVGGAVEWMTYRPNVDDFVCCLCQNLVSGVGQGQVTSDQRLFVPSGTNRPSPDRSVLLTAYFTCIII